MRPSSPPRRLPGSRRHGTPYDVAAAQLTLARIADQQGRRAEAVTHADRARSAIEPGGYRVLYRLFPDQAVPPAALWVPKTYATRRYSWMTPPTRSCRRTRK